MRATGFGSKAIAWWRGHLPRFGAKDALPWARSSRGTPTAATGAPPSAGETRLAAPIIFDMDADGVTVVPLAESSVRFDMVGDGKLRRTAWMDPGDALLVRDRNGNRTIDGIDEISFLGDKPGARTDLEGLAAFDQNADGAIDARDEGFVLFGLWFDRNANGFTDAGELQSLAEAGIVSISLTGTPTGQDGTTAARGESVIYNSGSFIDLGDKLGSFADVGLAYDLTPLGLVRKSMKGVVEFEPQTYDRKAGKFAVAAVNGTLQIFSRRGAVLDTDQARPGVAAMLSFRNGAIGYLDAIILDLDGDSLDIEKMGKSRALFDMDGNGVADDTGWIGKGDGFLVIDRNGDGLINDGSELSLAGETDITSSSLTGLSALDANRDGKLNGEDARFGELKVWRDANRNGVTDAGELLTLADMGITEIGLANASYYSGHVRPGRNIVLAASSFTRNGKTSELFATALAFKPGAPPPLDSFTPAAPSLPELPPEGDPAGAARTERQMAMMVQEMAAFGAPGGEGAYQRRDALSQPFDIFA